VKPENPNRQIMKCETQTFLQGDGFKMFANVFGFGEVAEPKAKLKNKC